MKAIGIWYLVLSLMTLAVYWRDKSAAQRRSWRTRESTLQVLALLGGWPGAWLGQIMLRHKSSKTGFKAVGRLMIAINIMGCASLVYFCSGMPTSGVAIPKNKISRER